MALSSPVPRLVIVAGGQSPEHDISLRSARRLFEDLRQEGSISVHVQIVRRDGTWLSQGESGRVIVQDHEIPKISESAGDPMSPGVFAELVQKDKIVLPMIHGATGEDGTLQGFLGILGIPYIGCGVRSSAVCMDKAVFKAIASQKGFPQTRYITLQRNVWQQAPALESLRNLRRPLVVKPSSLGSSIGVAKVDSDEELQRAVDTALELDSTCIVEEAVRTMWEFEICAIGPTFSPRLSCIGKIVNKNSFVGYEDKYGAEATNEFEVPAEIAPSLAERVRDIAREAYAVFGCESMARIDFLYDVAGDGLLLNEINTLPGFTRTSLFPVLWRESGISLPELLRTLMADAKG
ncbi:D-alanine--D-alanine [Dissoconium aciculare CBS 342.82]|uniref:D-alanine--D-alanine n=1 Tax=Dissoconium aciculare CBS 342.82 TaxID=1314786 RepID=A0A6J3M9E4_9PEZI|nr:D-alanine--D-alanine [Dissoconium aciculare CBS 342.82]KAF1824671.1 D-alanine--D-alanine [Dissoconium aciculare CBS 342.82]